MAKTVDSRSGITTVYYYDLIGRLVGYHETSDTLDHRVTYSYDEQDRPKAMKETVNGYTKNYSYTYNKEDKLASMTVDGITLNYTYDAFGRLSKQTKVYDGETVKTNNIQYTGTDTTTSNQISTFNGWTYTYNNKGYIASVTPDANTTHYTYNSAGYLIREDNQKLGKSFRWRYDKAGNITAKETYEHTTGELGTPLETITYTYGNNDGWDDLLTEINGMTATYDNVGNLVNLGNIETFTWKRGRELSAHAVAVELAIITQPKDCKGVSGANASFSVKASGKDLTYQWQYKEPNGSTWIDSVAETHNTSAISGFAISDARNGRLYRCVITDGDGNQLISNTAELIMVPIAITNQPNNFYGPEGSAVSFSLTAAGENLSYLWQVSTDDGATWSTSGAAVNNASTLTGFNATEARNGRMYRCIVSDDQGNQVISNTATLNMTSFAISRNPSNAWGILGDEVSFSVRAYGQNLTYQWQYSSNGGTSWSNSPAEGNKTNTLSGLTINSARLGMQYRCKVSNGTQELYSNVVQIKLKTKTWRNSYNADGIRIGRTDGTNTYTYIYDGSRLTRVQYNGKLVRYNYDESGRPISLRYNNVLYFVDTNLQGDVVGIRETEDNERVVNYVYDAYGKICSITGSMKDTLGVHNVLRYRGYVYDQETGLYYLQSRYYNPEWGRFISADHPELLGANGDFASLNLYAYCGNNPVSRADDGGQFWNIVIGAVVGGLVSGAVSAVTSYMQTGSVDWGAVAINAAVGAVSGAVAATGLGPLAQAGITAAVSGAGNYAEQVYTKGFDDVNYADVVCSALVGGGTSLLGSVAGKMVGGKLEKAGTTLLNKGKDKLLTGMVRESVGQSHTSLLRQGTKLVSQATKTLNTFRGISSTVGSFVGGVTGSGYNAFKICVLGW